MDNEEHNVISLEEIVNSVDQHFLPILQRKLSNHKKFILNVHRIQLQFVTNLIEQQQQETSIHQTQISKKVYKLELSKVLKKNLLNHDEKNFDTQFPTFVKALENFTKKQPKTIELVQSAHRFTADEQDKFTIKIAKTFKRIGFGLSRIFRGKNHQWKHEVHLRNITRFYWKEHLSQRLITLLNPIYRSINSATETMWNADKVIDQSIQPSINGPHIINGQALMSELKNMYQSAIDLLDNEAELIQKKARILMDKTKAEFDRAIERAGTVELSNNNFNYEVLHRKHIILNKSVQRLDKEWGNTTEVLRDDWYLILEVQLLKNIASVEYNKTTKFIDKKIQKDIIPQLDDIANYYQSLKDEMQATDNEEALKSVISTLIDDNKLTKYSRNAFKLDDFILYADLPKTINDIESHLDKSITIISKETSVCNNEDYQRPIKDSEITYSSIQEILRFECWPEYQKRSKEIKSKLTDGIVDIQNHLNSLSQIEEFNLVTAKEFLADDKKESNIIGTLTKDEDQSQSELVIQSMTRYIENIDALKKKILALFETIKKDLGEAIEGFKTKVDGLSEDDSMLAIKMKIATNAALEKSQKIKEQFRDNIKNFVPLVVTKSKDWYQQSIVLITNLQKKIGLHDPTQPMDLKLSEFLTTAEKSFENLPFIYKRLFRDEPLSEETYYIGRSHELESLKTALSRFQNNHYSSAIVLGEKGAGITSLLNYFCKSVQNQNPVLKIELQESYHTVSSFYELMSTLFDTPLTNLEETVTHISSLEKTIVVLENIHLLYLKKIDGFEVIKQLSELISMTSENIFWLLSCYQYSYNYLNRSIGLSENFRYEIKMEEFSNETMISIIKERHSVSGYSVKFQPSFNDLKSKKFNKLSPKEQQELLEDQYFTELNKLAKGNIRMALSYWLSTTKETTGNNLVINPMPQFDLSFLRNLPEKNLYILGALIQHDKLKLHALSQVMNIDDASVRRTLQTMIEFGLIVKRGEYSMVNPLLYRQCLTILESKNIIH